jgi:hypothetical protein
VLRDLQACPAKVGRRGLRRQPERLVLERVDRQLDPPRRAAEERRPVHVEAVRVRRREGRGECDRLSAVLPDGRRRQASPVELRFEQRGERGGGAELDECLGAVGLKQGADSVGEAYGAAQVADPVAGVGIGGLPGEVGDQRDGRRLMVDVGDGCAELFEDRVHVGGVEGVADAQCLGLASFGLEVFCDGVDGVVIAGDDEGCGGVDGSEGDRVGEVGSDFLLGCLDRDHRSACGGALHQACSCADEGGGVFEREYAGTVSGGDFPDRVADQVVRA